MSKVKKIIGYSFLGILVIMQLVPMKQPATSMNNPNDLMVNNELPTEVATKLKAACYDCHSNETQFPWYAYVAPVKWLVNRDTKEGREELNFSNWAAMDIMDQITALDEISTEVESGDMPMKIYPLMHSNAKLSPADRTAITKWAGTFGEGLFE
jgi:hypothetical protein